MTPLPEQAWIVVAEWADSSPTAHGPWTYAEEAEQWAHGRLDGAAACVSWRLDVLQPPVYPWS